MLVKYRSFIYQIKTNRISNSSSAFSCKTRNAPWNNHLWTWVFYIALVVCDTTIKGSGVTERNVVYKSTFLSHILYNTVCLSKVHAIIKTINQEVNCLSIMFCLYTKVLWSINGSCLQINIIKLCVTRHNNSVQTWSSLYLCCLDFI